MPFQGTGTRPYRVIEIILHGTVGYPTGIWAPTRGTPTNRLFVGVNFMPSPGFDLFI
jgi:hypothetical protein